MLTVGAGGEGGDTGGGETRCGGGDRGERMSKEGWSHCTCTWYGCLVPMCERGYGFDGGSWVTMGALMWEEGRARRKEVVSLGGKGVRIAL